MTLSIKTQVVWELPGAEPDSAMIIAEKVAELAAAGKEAGERDLVDGPGENQITVTRYWVDQDTAQEWVSFILQYNPVSATIVD